MSDGFNPLATWCVVLSCSDCTGEDPDGCFDGGTESVYEDPKTHEPIMSEDQANEIGWRIIANVGPWEFRAEKIDK